MAEEFEKGEYAVQPPVVKKINKHFIAIHDDNGVRLLKGDGTYADNYLDAKPFPSREMIRDYLKQAKWKDMKKNFHSLVRRTANRFDVSGHTKLRRRTGRQKTDKKQERSHDRH